MDNEWADKKEDKLIRARIKKLEEGALQSINAVDQLLKGRDKENTKLKVVDEEDEEQDRIFT